MIKIAPLKKYSLRAERPGTHQYLTEGYNSLGKATERKAALEEAGYTVLVTLSDSAAT